MIILWKTTGYCVNKFGFDSKIEPNEYKKADV